MKGRLKYMDETWMAEYDYQLGQNVIQRKRVPLHQDFTKDLTINNENKEIYFKIQNDFAVITTPEIKEEEPKKEIKKERSSDKEHLEFIYARLRHVYHENENIDYMLRFKKIIDKI